MIQFNSYFALFMGIVLLSVSIYILYGAWIQKENKQKRWFASLLARAFRISMTKALQAVSENAAVGKTISENLKLRTSIVDSNDFLPFRFNPMQRLEMRLSSSDIANEPRDYINASNATVWIYRSGGHITHMLEVGHANGPVCSQLSALITNTQLSLEDSSEMVLVPGLSLLHGSKGSSSLDLILSDTTEDKILRELWSSMRRDALQSLPASLAPFEKDTGLVKIINVEGDSYWQVQDRLTKLIEQYYSSSGESLLGRQDDSNTSSLPILMPYYILGNSKLTPLSIEVPLKLFYSEDMEYLVDVHKQTLVVEMRTDASRRKRIYEEWLYKDEKLYNEYGAFISGLSDEERKRQTLQVSATRIYETGDVVYDGEETFVSPHMYYTETLPQLLFLDKKWIDSMSKLSEEIDERAEANDPRLREINLAILIEAFLRGWVSVFLPNEEERKRYEKWCQARREPVWRFIHKELLEKKIRVEPLLEENTIFKIESVTSKVLRITPLHLINDGNFLIYLSKRYRIPFYIHLWSYKQSHKKYKSLNLEVAKEHYQRASKWLRMPDTKSSESECIKNALKEIKLAIDCHSEYTLRRFFRDWWLHYARDTRNAFNIYVEGIKGILFNELQPETAIKSLRKFISEYPNYLPDPYILLALHEAKEKAGLYSLLQSNKKLLNLVKDLHDNIEKQRAYLESNRATLERLQKYKGSHPNKHERDVIRISNEFLEKQESLEKYGNQLLELKTEIDDKQEYIWQSLESKYSRYLNIAQEIDPEYVRKILEEKDFKLSKAYMQFFDPLYQMLMGDEYVRIANQLWRISKDIKKAKVNLPQVKEDIDTALKENQFLSNEQLKLVNEFRTSLNQIELVDSITRELIVKAKLEQISQDYLKQGLEKYESRSAYLPQFTEVNERLVTVYSLYRHQYRKALQYMVNQKVTVGNFAPNSTIQILEKSEFAPQKIWFDKPEETLFIKDKLGHPLALARIIGLNSEEADHLQLELDNLTISQNSDSNKVTVEAVLNIRISPSPLSKRWSILISELEPILIHAMAYYGILPISNEAVPNEQLLENLGNVHSDMSGIDSQLEPRIFESILREKIGVEPESVSIIDV